MCTVRIRWRSPPADSGYDSCSCGFGTFHTTRVPVRTAFRILFRLSLFAYMYFTVFKMNYVFTGANVTRHRQLVIIRMKRSGFCSSAQNLSAQSGLTARSHTLMSEACSIRASYCILEIVQYDVCAQHTSSPQVTRPSNLNTQFTCLYVYSLYLA